MPSKKTNKKYEMKRSELREELEQIHSDLAAIDPLNETPHDVEERIEQLAEDLENLLERVDAEAL